MPALYIHIPFCVKKCLFCSFAISVGAGHRSDEYIDILEKEILMHRGKKISTVYLGGGTPTFLDHKKLARIMNMVKH